MKIGIKIGIARIKISSYRWRALAIGYFARPYQKFWTDFNAAPDLMHNGKRIVIVDDDPECLLTGLWILEGRGYDVLVLNECEDLTDRLRLFRPRLIFMDHSLPEMTGIEATRLIRSDIECARIPIVYFTNRDDVQALAAEAGADDWLRKPFRPEDLVSKVKKILPSDR